MNNKLKWSFWPIPLLTLLSCNLHAADGDLDSYLDLDLEDLLSMEITSVSKRKQRLDQAAAAIYVITNEDIRRSGVTSIADALRLAPGIQVARIDSNKWAVSSRGFNGQFANKLLVLMDGRSVYTSSYSGVYWEDQDTILEDIERIEVIRGPGATLWGANAVNGVINIITKSSARTQGNLFVAGAGDEESFSHIRSGFKLGEDISGRAYLKVNQRDSSFAPELDDEAGDDWDAMRVGFRFDSDADAASSWTLQGDSYDNDLNQTIKALWLDPFDPANNPPDLSDPYRVRNIDEEIVSRGYNLLARWQYQDGGDSIYTVQSYLDHSYREETILEQEIDTFDIDFQHQYQGFAGHDLVWGVGYRRIQDDFNGSFSVSIDDPDSLETELLSAFIQDEIALAEDLRLTVGSKFEENDYTGTEVQPNLRLIWLAQPGHSVWGSLSKAVRTPSAVERRSSIVAFIVPGLPLPPVAPLVSTVDGSEDFDAEKLTAFELGYRVQASETTSVDLALFYNQYQDVTSFETTQFGAGLDPANIPNTTTYPSQVVFGNKRDVTTQGLEAVVDWHPAQDWKMQAVYSYIDISDDLDDDSIDNISNGWIDGSTPEHQLSIRSSHDVTSTLTLDLWLYYVDELGKSAYSVGSQIDDYTSLNFKLNWQSAENMQVSLVGLNLNEDRHAEFIGENFISETELERSAYLQLTLDF
ncbi:MAG: TonB-dependent receptor [Gammaproteobacteria bacterium]|nr:TonB-dependent receptor [Gammaproteobacteria bacterium]